VVLHQAGQLAIYPIVPLERRGWLVGEYLQRLKQGLANTIHSLGVKTLDTPGRPGISGRSGVLASVGVAVRSGVSFHGAWLNVHPPAQYSSQIDAISPENTATGGKCTPGSLLAERHEPVTMSRVRAVLIEQLSAALDCPRQHVHSGHPLYLPPSRDSRERLPRCA
jgi:lipoate-protein ligase B